MKKQKQMLWALVMMILMLAMSCGGAYAAMDVELDNGRGSCYGQWRETSAGQIQFRCEVYNHHYSKTVRAFEMYAYATDVWDERIYGDGIIYYHTTRKNIRPGEHVYSEYITMPDYDDVYKVYAGIKRVIYTDGTTQELPDYQIEYSNWSIR